jgi:hypothetical protein
LLVGAFTFAFGAARQDRSLDLENDLSDVADEIGGEVFESLPLTLRQNAAAPDDHVLIFPIKK